jgi:pre-mRNA-splicing factor SYF2
VYRYEYNKSVSNVYLDAHSLDYATQDPPVPESIDKMANDLDAQLNKRDNRSKRRAVTGDEEVSYINERNRHFNRKIGRAFDKYTKDIKASLERGTALDE